MRTLVAEARDGSPAPSTDARIRAALGSALNEAREALHRHARLSTRHEALDEICKLLFAQIVSARDHGHGLMDLLRGSDRPAVDLAKIVRNGFAAHLPQGLSKEMPSSEFDLRLRPSEDELAVELATALAVLEPELVAEGHHDVFNEVFGTFLTDSFADEKQLGQYLTPPEVVRFMVDAAIAGMDEGDQTLLADPERCEQFGVILDPSCGVGSFLTFAARRLAATGDGRDVHVRDLTSKVLVGLDKSERMIRLALTSFAVLGAEEANLHLANSLSRRGYPPLLDELQGKAGLILTNPPFGAEFSGEAISPYRLGELAARVDSELLFIERYLDWLREGGAALAIVPDSVLTNRGPYQELRTLITSQATIEAVVSLPAETFSAAGTATKTSVLYLRKSSTRPQRAHRTYVALCSNVGFGVATRSSHRRKVARQDGQLPAILHEFASGEHLIGRRVRDIASAHRWDGVYHASLPEHVETLLLAPPLGAVYVGDVARLSAERIDPRRLGQETFKYIEISDVDGATGLVRAKDVQCREAPSRARKHVAAGDVLVSTVRPERRAVGVVPPELDGAVCSTGFAVLRPERIDPTVLAALLRSDFVTSQILRNNMGVAYPAVDEGCLGHVLLPVEDGALSGLQAQAEAVRRAQVDWYRAQTEFAAALTASISGFTGT